jgi:voltage-gated potassium channel
LVRSALGFHASLLGLCLAINLLASVGSIEGRRTRRILLPFLVVVVAMWGGMAWLDQVSLVPMSLALWTVVALLAVARALRFALGAQVVDREHLYAWFSAYLLAGIVFGVVYWVLEQTGAGTRAIPGEGAQRPFSLAMAIYYSFATLTRLGYGDSVPQSEVARGLTILEVVLGHLYLAVMIVHLARLYVSGEGKGNQREA